jgi:hypothetical protein
VTQRERGAARVDCAPPAARLAPVAWRAARARKRIRSAAARARACALFSLSLTPGLSSDMCTPRPAHYCAPCAPGSAHFAQCLRYHLHPKADVVLLEFSVNDGHGNEGSTASVERIVRRVLHTRGGIDAGPALLIVNWWDHWPRCVDNAEKAVDGACALRLRDWENGHPLTVRAFAHNAACRDTHSQVAAHVGALRGGGLRGGVAVLRLASGVPARRPHVRGAHPRASLFARTPRRCTHAHR